jgi:hypothetical protein
MPDYSQYQHEISADIESTLNQLQSQPILFVGSGFTPGTRAIAAQLDEVVTTKGEGSAADS